jgi:PPK2 family polyphosphate:nucleotide phosphotransferase
MSSDLPLDPRPYRVVPGSRVNLSDYATAYDGPIDRDDAEAAHAKLSQEIQDLQEKLYAEGKRSLLVVLQAMDGIGKDSTVRHVFGPINPAGCKVVSFKAPSKLELDHDYLWRIHHACPPRGTIGVFNRSHYEDVLIVRVKHLAPPEVWQRRYGHINDFEQRLADEGTVVRKFYLHGSKDYQKERLRKRLDDPAKHWKFNPGDLVERDRWGDYMEAFGEALTRCSTDAAPWYIVPAERRWFRNLLIATVVADTLRAMDPQTPKPDFDVAAMRRQLA